MKNETSNESHELPIRKTKVRSLYSNIMKTEIKDYYRHELPQKLDRQYRLAHESRGRKSS